MKTERKWSRADTASELIRIGLRHRNELPGGRNPVEFDLPYLVRIFEAPFSGLALVASEGVRDWSYGVSAGELMSIGLRHLQELTPDNETQMELPLNKQTSAA